MSLLSFWSEASLWGKLGYIILAIALYFVVKSAIQMKKSNALQIMQFIKKNQDEGNVAVGRMSCWSKHGYDGKVEHYETEYMYIVDGKSYYITYAISCSDTVSLTDQEKVDTVDLALEMPSAAIIYYDPKNPKKAHIKKEVFCDADEFYRIKTKKNNRYRSVGREWILPVDLISD